MPVAGLIFHLSSQSPLSWAFSTALFHLASFTAGNGWDESCSASPPSSWLKIIQICGRDTQTAKKQNKLRCLLFYLNNRRKIIFDYILRLKFINHENQKKALTSYLLKAEDPIFSSIIFQSGNHLASFASFLRQVGAGIGLVWSGEHLQRRRRGRRRRSRGRRRRRVGWWERCTSPIVRSASSLLAHQSPSWAKPATINQSFSAYILNHHSTQCLTNV